MFGGIDGGLSSGGRKRRGSRSRHGRKVTRGRKPRGHGRGKHTRVHRRRRR